MSQEPVKEMVLQVIEMADALDRLKSAAEKAPLGEEARRWVDRFLLLRKRVEGVLSAQGVISCNSLGQPYNPELHNVVEVAPPKENRPGTILEVHAEAYAWQVAGRMTALRKGDVVIAGSSQ